MSWSITEAIEWLNSHASYEASGQFTQEPSLEGVRSAIDFLGIAGGDFRTIHVTGTNGKGSVARIASELVEALGYKVGTFVSPHLHRINERIMLNNQPVSDELLASELLVVSGIEHSLLLSLSWFEVLTVTALSLFYAEGVEVVVIEVGIGGTWDSTNVIDGDVSVVTSVGHDHLDLLGPSLVDVARNKAGIIKPRSRAVVGRLKPELLSVVAERPNSGLAAIGRDIAISAEIQAVGGWLFDLRTNRTVYLELFVSLHGKHQIDNAALAIAAVEELVSASLNYDLVASVLANLSIAGRGEVIFHSPLVLIDGAHNFESATALSGMLQEEFLGVEPKVGVLAMLTGKDPGAVIGPLLKDLATLVVSSVGEDRSIDVDVLVNEAKGFGIAVEEAPSVEAAVSRAMSIAGDEGAVVVFGSFRTAAKARAFLLS